MLKALALLPLATAQQFPLYVGFGTFWQGWVLAGQGDMLAEVHRLQGELLLRQAVPDAPQAEACFHHALAVARRQQAKSWELRAALSLSRLWQHQGQHVEARELLAPI